jgi:isopropylmalate/homocitrate/citramalate synthase
MQIEDKTLREGQQRSGTSFSVAQKVEAARQLDTLGVDAIQVGFPIANDGTTDVIEQLNVDADLTGTARAIERDIDACLEAGVDIIGFGVPASKIQRERILGMNREDLKELVTTMYDYCCEFGLPIQVSTMDGFRTDPDFINELIDLVDVEYFGISDTVGIRKPWEVVNFLEQLECELSNIRVHFHCDLGLGTANALAAARCGVGKVDVTCGGIGERVGNVPLGEFIVAADLADEPLKHNVNSKELIPAIKSVLSILKEDIPKHKPILGETAYEHESGMHTAEMIDEPSTFEPFDPAQFGGERRLLFGPSSGHKSARLILEESNVAPSEENTAVFLEHLHNLDEHIGFTAAVELARSSF